MHLFALFCSFLLFCAFRVKCPTLRQLQSPVDKVGAATLFRRAAGVYMHLAKNVLPPMKASLPTESCPEVTPALASIMSIICLAEAQVHFIY